MALAGTSIGTTSLGGLLGESVSSCVGPILPLLHPVGSPIPLVGDRHHVVGETALNSPTGPCSITTLPGDWSFECPPDASEPWVC